MCTPPCTITPQLKDFARVADFWPMKISSCKVPFHGRYSLDEVHGPKPDHGAKTPAYNSRLTIGLLPAFTA